MEKKAEERRNLNEEKGFETGDKPGAFCGDARYTVPGSADEEGSGSKRRGGCQSGRGRGRVYGSQ